jgi:hypothetical protein
LTPLDIQEASVLLLLSLIHVRAFAPLVRRVRLAAAGDRGQTTAEYALVLLGAASVALVLVAWAAKSGKLAELFDAVVDGVIGKV